MVRIPVSPIEISKPVLAISKVEETAVENSIGSPPRRTLSNKTAKPTKKNAIQMKFSTISFAFVCLKGKIIFVKIYKCVMCCNIVEYTFVTYAIFGGALHF